MRIWVLCAISSSVASRVVRRRTDHLHLSGKHPVKTADKIFGFPTREEAKVAILKATNRGADNDPATDRIADVAFEWDLHQTVRRLIQGTGKCMPSCSTEIL